MNKLVDEAYEYAYQRAREEGDVDIDKDYKIIERWVSEFINSRMESELTEFSEKV